MGRSARTLHRLCEAAAASEAATNLVLLGPHLVHIRLGVLRVPGWVLDVPQRAVALKAQLALSQCYHHRVLQAQADRVSGQGRAPTVGGKTLS